jgi:glyoxylase-like metal-dependent hydrolase (beta-lactamase superfamily II)
MQRERVADDIYVFTSDLYAQVTAGVVLTTEGAIVIDTLVYPEETLLIKRFIETRLGTNVRYVINTHFHADHTTGTCFFSGAKVVSHAMCRDLLNTRGRQSIEQAQGAFSEMRDVSLRLPDVVFDDGVMNLHVGNKTLQLWHTPGHSADSIVCLVKEDRVLFAADTVMPIPYFVGGDFNAFVNSLNSLRQGNFENIIQGHGEVILRGEIEEKLQEDIDYLLTLQSAVNHALNADHPEQALQAIDVESCGKSRILLNGTVEQLHRGNVQTLVAHQRELLHSN